LHGAIVLGKGQMAELLIEEVGFLNWNFAAFGGRFDEFLRRFIDIRGSRCETKERGSGKDTICVILRKCADDFPEGNGFFPAIHNEPFDARNGLG